MPLSLSSFFLPVSLSFPLYRKAAKQTLPSEAATSIDATGAYVQVVHLVVAFEQLFITLPDECMNTTDLYPRFLRSSIQTSACRKYGSIIRINDLCKFSFDRKDLLLDIPMTGMS